MSFILLRPVMLGLWLCMFFDDTLYEVKTCEHWLIDFIPFIYFYGTKKKTKDIITLQACESSRMSHEKKTTNEIIFSKDYIVLVEYQHDH